MIRLSFKVNEGSHIYQIHEDVDSLLAYFPTLLRLYPHRGFSVVDLSSSLPISEHESYGIRTAFYDGPVELTIRLKAEDDIQLGEHELVGAIGYQTCKLTSCDPPTGAVFTSRIQVTDRDTPASTEPNPLEFAEVDYRFGLEHQDSSWVHPKPGTRLVASRALAGTTASSVRSSDIEVNPAGQSEVGTQPKQPSDSFLDRLKSSNEEKASIFVALGFALLGGFVLNFMPCVLPVIGLKVMSFVQQAGANRVQAFVLNVWYTVGILSVFMVLATLSVLLKLGWGDQSQFAPFQIGMAALVFVMSLAFFGIWEIPIPGFVGSSKAAKVAEQEGPLAALTKGILTTILAVPCTGPGLAFALAWSNNQPAYLVYLVFLFIGFGMAAPYIVLGLNPKLISFLPKPGLWMEQLKQVLGFLLLGTVIWLLWTVPLVYMLPAMCFLFGLWFACWWIGSLPITATKSRRLGAWGIAVAASILVGWFSFATLLPAVSGKLDRELSSLIQNSDITLMELESGSNWRHFSMDLLLQEVENNNTLLLDFTADWCATCIALKKAVLNTELVESKIEELGVVKISVDFSKANPDGTELLKRLTGYSQIPVVAIFPAGKADEPIVFVGGYTQSQLLEALDRAGHSKSALPRTSISQR
ncbi:MAG TPA: cytochrome c biogenesis protein CcdA [Pirellulaceae bacterium]|nr:cytochrome c biogenesis protein CcdA [Pirellulaceae bacterium]